MSGCHIRLTGPHEGYRPGDVLAGPVVVMFAHGSLVACGESDEDCIRGFYSQMRGARVDLEDIQSFEEFRKLWLTAGEFHLADVVAAETPVAACGNCAHYLESDALHGNCGLGAEIKDVHPHHACGSWKAMKAGASR